MSSYSITGVRGITTDYSTAGGNQFRTIREFAAVFPSTLILSKCFWDTSALTAGAIET